MEIKLEDITVYTLTGKKHLYKLGDGAYGEWLIFKENIPVYYLNIFDDMYAMVDQSIKSDPWGYLEKRFKIGMEGYSLSQHIHGIWSSKVTFKQFEIEKLPISFLVNATSP